MSTSKADRLRKLFEGDSLPPPPDPSKPHIADSEILPKLQPMQKPWSVPKVAQKPRKVTKSPPRTGRDIEQFTSSDDDEYIRAFKKKPTVKPETPRKSRKNLSGSPAQQQGQKPTAKVRSDGTDADQETDDGVSQMDRDGNPLIGRFCPFMAVTKFCYKYMDDPNDRVSRHFFASGKIYNRKWDIYYIHPPASLFAKHILLVPANQVQQLINEINSTFHISITIPRHPFLQSFYKDCTPAPSFLGTTQSREAVAEMEGKIPTPAENHGECPPEASPEMERSFASYKRKCEKATAITKKKGATSKKNRANDRLTAQVNLVEALKRGQRYLGLRPRDREGGLLVPDASLTWDEQQRFEREQKLKYGHILKPLDLETTAPHPFDLDVVLVSVDVEAWEENHDVVTEVGISTLDTADIKSVPPGYGGFNWMERIRSRHFRIAESMHLKNTKFVMGDPDGFLFGRSEVVPRNDIGKWVDSCFEPPYSAGFMHDGKFRPQDQKIGSKLERLSLDSQDSASEMPQSQFHNEPVDTRGPDNAEQDLANKAAISKVVSPSEVDEVVGASEDQSGGHSNNGLANGQTSIRTQKDKTKLRNVILVGHDLDQDLNYLSNLQSKIFHEPPLPTYPQPLKTEDPLRQHILESLDTAKLYKAYRLDDDATSLSKVLVGVERTGWGLHNGGNDARYALEAMVGILVRSRLQEDFEVEQKFHAEDGLTRKIREKQEAVEREEREAVALWKHAFGPYGERYEEQDLAVLSDPYVSSIPTQANSNQEKSREESHNKSESATTPTPTHGAITQPQSYPWMSIPSASRDGGEPRGFKMPESKAKAKGNGGDGKKKVSSNAKRREQVLKLQGEGEIGGPCDWSPGGADGW